MIDTKLLRQKLIDMALRGQLVEQRPEDGNATDLLEQIRAEKAALIKAGKIKKEKPLPEIKEEEKPFAIPDSWCWVRLGEISAIVGGFAFQSLNYVKQGIRIIRISDFNNCGFINNDIVRYEYDDYLCPYEIQENDILLCMTGGTVGKNMIVSRLKERLFINQRVAIIRAYFQGLQQYIYANIRSDFIQKVINRSKNSLNDNISMKVINNFLIPLPPLAEQKRIVTALESCLKLVDTIAKDSADLDKALKFLRQKMLDMAVRGQLVEQRPEDGNATDLLEQIRAEKAALIKAGKIKKEKPLPEIKEEEKPFAIPANWCWVRLGEIGIVQTGKTPPTNDREFWRNDTPFITPGDMLNGSINYANRSVSFAGEKFSRTVSSGTVLQVCIGGSIGKISMVDRKVCFNQQINAVSSIICDSSYIYFAMQNELFISALKRRACGTATPIINLSVWQQLLVPLPPLAEQKRIVAKLEQINALIETMLN